MKGFTLPDPSTWSRRERVLALSSLLVIALVLLDGGVLRPWWAHMQMIDQDVERLEQSMAAHQKLLTRKASIQAEATAYQDYVQLPSAEDLDMATLLREVEQLARKSQMTLGEVKPLATDPEKPLQLGLQIKYEGSLQAWVRFVHLLESSTSLLEIQRAAVGQTEEGSDVLEGSLRLTAMTSQRDQEPLQPPDVEGIDGAVTP